MRRTPHIKSVETKYEETRQEIMASLENADRRHFMRVSAACLAAALGKGVTFPHSFQPVKIETTDATTGAESFRFAYISDSHLYAKDVNDRFVRSLLRAVDDVNALDPQPDFVFYGGDLAQLGQKEELDLGAEILKNVKAPVKMMVGEHDWYLDMGEKWRDLFGPDRYSWDHKGVHFVVLNSVIEEDFWTERKLTPRQRMMTVAGLDNNAQRPFTVGEEQRGWLKQDLAKISPDTPVIVFSHSPLYKVYKKWNFWTDDAEQVQELLFPFQKVTVIHGHTHQLLTNRIKNIQFHGMLSTAWPWPYAPQGMPELTVQMNRSNPFNPQDGCGDGRVHVYDDGLVDAVYDLWNRNPVTVSRAYLNSWGRQDKPVAPTRKAY